MTWKGNGKPSRVTLERMYDCEHSPVRTQVFWIELLGVLSFVSVHLGRHKVGVEHFVQSNREDRGGSGDVNRRSPVNHGMFVNAQGLINMARKRLCFKAHKETRETMEAIKKAVAEVDPVLAEFMVKECEYRRGCHELKTCGWWERNGK
jgi:hypothetical protein